jgi:regulator of protease activity HflC (stomatin/prohibitin superfamily)
MEERMPHFKKVSVIVVVAVALLVIGLFSSSIFETNTAGYLQIKQAAVTGDLTCRLEPGMYGQFFGDIHTYKEASTFYFTADHEMGEARDQSLPTQFNDGAKARVSGSVRVLLPNTDCVSMTTIHRKFKSMDGVMLRLVLPAMRKALFASGPHMTAAESYAERRNEFATLVEDQLLYGIIATEKEPQVITDPITGEEKTIFLLRKIRCDNENGTTCVGGFKREQKSAFHEFAISLTNFVIDDVVYPKPVLAQIETQRAARMNIITKEAEAKEAEARAKKADAEARAKIAETRATEEVAKTQKIVQAEAEKEQAILQAEKQREVAKLQKEAAAFEKQKQILLGEGESARKRLVMQADGALKQKLEAWVEAQKVWAEAYSKRNVPHTVFGGASGDGGHGDADVQRFLQLMSVRAAKDLSLDMGVKGNTNK